MKRQVAVEHLAVQGDLEVVVLQEVPELQEAPEHREVREHLEAQELLGEVGEEESLPVGVVELSALVA